MAFWSGDKLLKEVPLRGIIEPYDPEKIDCSAYTLTLGPEFFVSPDYTTPPRGSVTKHLAPPSTISLGGAQRQIPGGDMVIPSGQFALLLTEEFVRIPADAMGFISLKFGVKGPGLINVSGFHVDPGYEGRLIFSVYNAGPESSHLQRGQDVFLLWLADLDQESSKDFVKSPPRDPRVSIPMDLISRADAPIHSLKQLSERIEELDREVSLLKKMAGYSVAFIAFVASMVAIWTFIAPDKSSPTASEAALVTKGHSTPAPQLPAPTESSTSAKGSAGNGTRGSFGGSQGT